MGQREREERDRQLRERAAQHVKRPIGYAELMAIDPTVIQRGSDFFFLDMCEFTPPNERVSDDVTIVYVRGSQEHHSNWRGNSYEDLLDRLKCAFAGDELGQEWDRRDRWGYAEGERPLGNPPKVVILCIDSRGGVVAGLNETVAAMQKMRKAAKVKLVAHVNEMAASAAYAIACACDAIVAPKSAILGSVGTISTMVSCAEKDAIDGIEVVLITSGVRKGDGHPHAPITKEAVAAERARVDALAADFFKIVSKSRGLSVDKIRSFQAAIFLGDEAVKAGLADKVASLDDVVASYSSTNQGTYGPGAKGNETDRRATLDKSPLSASVSTATVPASGANMDLAELIQKTEAALAAATDPAKRDKLAKRLASYKLTQLRAEKPDTDGDDDDEGDDDSEADKHRAKAEEEGKKAEASKHRAKAAEHRAKAAEYDEKAKSAEGDDEEEEDEAEESKAALALVRELTGMTGKAALGALQAIASTAANTAKDVAELKKVQAGATKASLIKEHTGKYVTPKEAAWLASQPMSVVQGFVDMRVKSGVIVHTDETTLVKPSAATPGTEESLSPEARAIIDAAVDAWAGDKEAFRKAQVAAHLKAHNDQIKTALNGAPGRI